MCWCWPCRSPCISVEEVDPSEKSYYRARPNSKHGLYAQSTSSKKSKYLSSVSSVSSDGSSKASSLPKSSSKHHITQNTTMTKTTTTNGLSTRRALEKVQTKHNSHSINADIPPRRRPETAPNGDKKSSPSKSQRGRNSSTSSSERSSRSKSRRGRNPSTASSQRSSLSKSHRERHTSTASSERTSSSKTLYSAKPKSSRGRKDIEIDPAITKKAISESVSSGSSTLVESEEEGISTKNPSSETLLDVSQTSPSPTPSLRRSRRKLEGKYTISDGRAEDAITVTITPSVAMHDRRIENPRMEDLSIESPRTESPRTESPRTRSPRTGSPRTGSPRTGSPRTGSPRTGSPRTGSPRTESLRTESPRTESPLTESPLTESPRTGSPRTGSPKAENLRTQSPKTESPKTENSTTVAITTSTAIRSSPPERRRHKPTTRSTPTGAFDPVANMSQEPVAKVNAPARRQHRTTGAQASAQGEPFNPLLGMSFNDPSVTETAVADPAATCTDTDSSTSSTRRLKLVNGPRSPEEFQQDISSFVQAMKFNTFYSEDDPYVQKVSDKAAELVRRKATITSDDEKTCIPDDIAGMAKVALYDVVFLCDDSVSMQQDRRAPALQEMVRRIAKITGLFETEGIKVRCINSTQDGEFNNIRTLEDVEAVMSKIRFNGTHTRIGTRLWDKILKPLVFDKIDSNSLTRPLIVSIITDGQPSGEEQDAFRNTIAQCRRELMRRGYDPSLVVFQVNQVGNDTQATKFIHGLLRFRNVYCTSELLDVKMESLKGNNLQLENWLVTRLTQGISPTPDSDE
ncbi:hypothetical protein P167DRAFT_534109 [Morchella conica CCBAS932]|uniref:VWFA domain-containing protein n=1 Tax=Morchella conica CCBAS932 TaxID=1392247 RepID=A0A3N4L119_9PEZI|nr:hypothetical protein P167DRAFT_534109 [Morchella conica CCBAS932]